MGCTPSRTMFEEQVEVTEVGTDPATMPSFHRDFVLAHKLGKGAFGSVYVAWRREGGEAAKVAVKVVDFRVEPEKRPSTRKSTDSVGKKNSNELGVVSPKKQRAAEKEVRILRSLPQSPNIVAFLGEYTVSGLAYIVMELCSMRLLTALEGLRRVDEGAIRRVLGDVVTGLAACHSVCVVHRDVKADNFLATVDSSCALGFRVKLCDFGLATSISTPDASQLSGAFGTPPYMAPEMLTEQKYGAKVDMFALGAVAHVMLFGRWPYAPAEQSAQAMKAAISANESFTKFMPSKGMPAISRAPVAWMKALLRRDPAQRMSAKQALAHPAFLTEWSEGEDASSLRPVMLEAKRIGGFEGGNDGKTATPLDARLMTLNKYHSMEAAAAAAAAPNLVKRRPSAASSDISTAVGSDVAMSCPMSP